MKATNFVPNNDKIKKFAEFENRSKNDFDGCTMPFQNRRENIKTIAETFTLNREASFRHERNLLKLISFSQCMGTGKTRVSKDFLEILKCEKYKKELYDKRKYLFDHTLLFYFDFSDFNTIGFTNFNDSFFRIIYAQIFVILKITIDPGRLRKKARNCDPDILKLFLEDMFINQNIAKNLKSFRNYSSEEEILKSDVEQVKKYIESNVKKTCEFIILSFDEVSTLMTFDNFSLEEFANLQKNFNNDVEESKKNDKKFRDLNTLYYLWNNYFSPLNCSSNIGLMIAGKNAFTPYVGRRAYSDIFKKASPTQLLHVALNNLSLEDVSKILIEMIFSGQYPNFIMLKHFFMNKRILLTEILELIHSYSGGLGRIVHVILRKMSDLSNDGIQTNCGTKDSFQKYLLADFKYIGKEVTANPFGKNKELTHLFLLAKSGKTFDQNLSVNQIFGLSNICPQNYLIEDAFLQYGIPYSEQDDHTLKINIPKFFENQFLEQSQLFKGDLYTMILNEYRMRKTNEHPDRIFEMLMGYAFYKILEISPNENAKFIEENIDGTSLMKSFKIFHCDRISAKNNEILTNLGKYFEAFGTASLNFPQDKSYGPDAMICLPLIVKFKIFIGLQMKNYFSGRTKISETKILEEAKKMKNLIDKMDQKTKNEYKRFYLVIICPCYCEETLEKFFPKKYKRPTIENMWKISEKDFATFDYDYLKVILLHPEFVSNIAAEEFIHSEKKAERMEAGEACSRNVEQKKILV